MTQTTENNLRELLKDAKETPIEFKKVCSDSRNIPINKGNYSMDTKEREEKFEDYRGEGWMEEYKKYREDWYQLPKELKVRDYPLLVDLELASICNLKCPMCYTISNEFKKKVNTKLMDWELFKKVIDEIGGKVPAIRLSFRGEALLHKKFAECVRYAKSKGIKEVSTLTNGARLTPDFFKEVCDAGIDWITISVDGTGEMYEKIRKPIKFLDLLNNIKSMHEYKQKKGLHRPVIKVQGIWPAIREDIQKYYDTFEPIVDLVAFNPLIDYLFKDTKIEYECNFTCPQQYQRLVIGADGLVMKCSNDEENEEIMGDIKNQSVHQVWHGDKLNAIRNLQIQDQGFLKSEVCKRCYVPRLTNEEEHQVSGRKFIVRNYVDRIQEIGM